MSELEDGGVGGGEHRADGADDTRPRDGAEENAQEEDDVLEEVFRHDRADAAAELDHRHVQPCDPQLAVVGWHRGDLARRGVAAWPRLLGTDKRELRVEGARWSTGADHRLGEAGGFARREANVEAVRGAHFLHVRGAASARWVLEDGCLDGDAQLGGARRGHELSDEAEEAREPMQEEEHADGQLDEGAVAVREGDLVLPASEDARGTQDAGELDQAQQAQHADRAEQGGARDFGRVDAHQEPIHRDDGDDVQGEPAFEVVERDALVRLDGAAALEDWLLVREEEVEDDVHHKDEVDDGVDHEERREPHSRAVVPRDGLPHEANLVGRHGRSEEERAEREKVPVRHELASGLEQTLVHVGEAVGEEL